MFIIVLVLGGLFYFRSGENPPDSDQIEQTQTNSNSVIEGGGEETPPARSEKEDGIADAQKDLSAKTLYTSLKKEPEILHPIRSTDLYAFILQNYVYDSLLNIDLQTGQFEPHLAKSWKVSPDGLTFTFHLRPGVKWQDGRPLTAHDVVFSFKAYQDPTYGGIAFISYFDHFKSFEAVDDLTVVVKAKHSYFKSLFILGFKARVLPKHIYQDKDNKKLNNSMMGSGPYSLLRYDRGKQVVFEQNPNWWGREVKGHFHRIKKLGFRFVVNPEDMFKRMASGSLDYILPDIISPDEYFTFDTKTSPWGEGIFKEQVQNKEPLTYHYVGWNLRNPLFQDVKVRTALAHLMNRELINQKILYNTRDLASSAIYPASDYAPDIKPIAFDPAQASRLLKEVGWEDTDQNGVLDKMIDGAKREFRFTLIFSKDIKVERIFTIYQHALRKAGIVMSIQVMEWSTFLSKIANREFEALYIGWYFGLEGLDPDPKELWHSESSLSGGSNYMGYSNPEVDRLIEEGRKEMNRAKRVEIFKQVYKQIAEDHPILLLFYSKYRLYSKNSKIEVEKAFFDYGLGYEFWQLKGGGVSF